MKRLICFFVGHRPWKKDVDGPPVLTFTNDARDSMIEIHVCDRCCTLYGTKTALVPPAVVGG